MIQTDIDHKISNEKNSFSSPSSELQPNSSFTPINKSRGFDDSSSDSDTHTLSSSNYNNNTEDDNIDWEFVTKQLETKLQTSIDIIQSQSDENYHTRLPPKIPKKYRFRPISNHGSTVTQQTDDTITLHSAFPTTKQNITTTKAKRIINPTETDISSFSTRIDQTSVLHELFNELTACQQKQAFLLEQIQRLVNQSEQMSSSTSSSSTFFSPLNSYNSKDIPSLQDAFQQRKSSFIQQSKERVKQIYHHNSKYHHRIIPNIKQTDNTYLQQRRQYENDRLCAMIIKHQNRQNAKIYGNLIKNHLCHN